MLYINIHLFKGAKAIEKKLSYNGKRQPAPRHPPARKLCPAALRMILGPTGKRRALYLSAPLQWRWRTWETVPKWPRCAGEELVWSGMRFREWSLKLYFLLKGWESEKVTLSHAYHSNVWVFETLQRWILFFFLLKYCWHTILYLFQVYNIVIPQFYTLLNAQHKCSHL